MRKIDALIIEAHAAEKLRKVDTKLIFELAATLDKLKRVTVSATDSLSHLASVLNDENVKKLFPDGACDTWQSICKHSIESAKAVLDEEV